MCIWAVTISCIFERWLWKVHSSYSHLRLKTVILLWHNPLLCCSSLCPVCSKLHIFFKMCKKLVNTDTWHLSLVLLHCLHLSITTNASKRSCYRLLACLPWNLKKETCCLRVLRHKSLMFVCVCVLVRDHLMYSLYTIHVHVYIY